MNCPVRESNLAIGRGKFRLERFDHAALQRLQHATVIQRPAVLTVEHESITMTWEGRQDVPKCGVHRQRPPAFTLDPPFVSRLFTSWAGTLVGEANPWQREVVHENTRRTLQLYEMMGAGGSALITLEDYPIMERSHQAPRREMR